MNITELDSYNLADAVKFNDHLNPRIWDASEHLHPEVRERLLAIADDFRESLGIRDLAVEDITISGSNAAYTYTPNSDIDLHLVVDVPNDEVYRELFNAKKFQYNEQHDIEIGGADVELYVQDTKEPHISQGVYSVKNNRWVTVPRRVKSVVDDTSTRNKFETVGHQIERAIKSGNVKRMTRMIDKIKKMRQTGLENHGEFGPENLAFKLLRNQGLIKRLYDARIQVRDQELSLVEQQPRQPFVYGFKKVKEASSPDGVSPETKMFLSEEPPVDDESVLRDFVDFCVAELKIEHLPTIKLRKDPQWSVRNRTFGRYTDDQHMLEVAWGNRHIMDVLRTVAHELTHKRQHERDGKRMGPDAGETGSPYENEANARAGVLMRDYGRLHPELFDAGQEELDEGLEQSLSSMVDQDQAERNEYAQFVKSQAGGDWTKGAKMYAQIKKRPANDIFGDAARLNQFMKMTFDFDKFTDEDWDNYWLLAQHCDDNRAFQKQALATIKKYQGTDHSHYKYLYDRISVGLTGKQKYGTQNVNGQQVVAEDLNEGLRSRAAAAAVVATLLGQPVTAAAQSIQGILGMIRDAGSVAQQAQNITRAGLNSEVQQEIVNYVRGVGGDAGSQNLSQLYQIQRQLQQQEQQPEPDPQRREPQNESASGYIPTKKQAKDPRYSMALSVDIHPGQVGKEANKLKLRTDRQGHPQIANPNGLFEQLMMELKQFQDLDEVRMGPKDLKRFADSPEAKGIRAGFEAELIFTGIGEPEYDEMEADMDADERAYSIQQVIDFFQNDDWGYGISDRAADRLMNELDEMYLEWRDDQIRNDFRHDSEDLITELWLEERPMTERIHDALTDGLELSDDEADAVIVLHARRERGEISGSDMSEDELEMESKYSEARSIAMDILEEDVQGSIDNQDGIYDQALDDYRDNYSGDDDSFFSDVGLRWMSDIGNQFNLDWPYLTGGGGGEGGWSENSADMLADSLAKALGVKVKVSNGYHSATRDDTSWIIEPDSSLNADDSDNMAAEIVSPPMPLDECLAKMEDFFAWAESEGAYANSSTGFHMGVSLPTKFHEDVDFTKLALFLGDEHVLKEFGRSANTYCRSAMGKIRDRVGSDRGTAVGGALELMKNNLIELAHRSIADNMGFGKYTSINPKGNYIEFRSAGGTNYFEDLDKLKNTLLRYARAMKIAGDPAAERNEYAKKLYKLIAPAQQDPALALFSRFSAGELSGQELKKQWADLALMKERPKNDEDREWEAYDPDTGEVLGTTKDFSITNATNYFRDEMKLNRFQVREREPELTSPRAKLAKRIVNPKQEPEQTVDDYRGKWEFFYAPTGRVLDAVDDASIMQARAVLADTQRRYDDLPADQIQMRKAEVEPDVAQNFSAQSTNPNPTIQEPQQVRMPNGVPVWEIYERGNGHVVHVVADHTMREAHQQAQTWLTGMGVEDPSLFAVRPKILQAGERNLSPSISENFADGKGPGRPGDSARHGIPKHATMAELEKSSHSTGRKGELARWQLNMRRGKEKAK